MEKHSLECSAVVSFLSTFKRIKYGVEDFVDHSLKEVVRFIIITAKLSEFSPKSSSDS